ncbi:MAG: RHS repeat protein [Myxococcales bacterium]|nr:RHS repeat protein [Myxococcales bacterium]
MRRLSPSLVALVFGACAGPPPPAATPKVDPTAEWQRFERPAWDAPCGEERRGCALRASSVTYAFDDAARLVAARFPNATMRYAFDDAGRLERIGHDRDHDGKVDHVRVSRGDDASREVEDRTIDETAQTFWPYAACFGAAADHRSCQRLRVDSHGGGRFGATRTTLDEEGRAVRVDYGLFPSHQFPEHVETTYDDAGRMVRRREHRLRYEKLEEWEYDAEGTCVRETSGTVGHEMRVLTHVLDEAGRVVRTTDAEGRRFDERTYDDRGRLVRIDSWLRSDGFYLSPDTVSWVETYEHDGDRVVRRTRSWDDDLHREVAHLDAAGRVERLELFEGPAPPLRVVTSTYDEEGRLVRQETRSRGAAPRVRTTRYDSWGGRVTYEPDVETCSVEGPTCPLLVLDEAPVCRRACEILLDYERGTTSLEAE